MNSINITEEPCLLLNSLDWGFALDGDYMLPNFNLRCLEDELTVIVDVKNVQDQLVHVVLPLYHVPLFVNAKAMNVKIPLTLRRTFGSRNINPYMNDFLP